MVQGDMGRDASRQQVVDEARIEVQALLIDAPVPLRVDARPCDGHAEALDSQGLHELDVARVAVVKVIRQCTCARPEPHESQ